MAAALRARRGGGIFFSKSSRGGGGIFKIFPARGGIPPLYPPYSRPLHQTPGQWSPSEDEWTKHDQSRQKFNSALDKVKRLYNNLPEGQTSGRRIDILQVPQSEGL